MLVPVKKTICSRGDYMRIVLVMVLLIAFSSAAALGAVMIGNGFLFGFGSHADNDPYKPVESYFGVNWLLGFRYHKYFGAGLASGLNAYWGLDTALLIVPARMNLGLEWAFPLGANSHFHLGGSIGISPIGVAQSIIQGEFDWLSALLTTPPMVHWAFSF